MGSYRNKLDIIADVLNAVSDGAKKTRVMYKANLSYRLLTKYLEEVVKVGLVYFEVGKELYLLTYKGKKFLERYKEYSRRNRHVEKQVNDVLVKRKILEDLCSSS